MFYFLSFPPPLVPLLISNTPFPWLIAPVPISLGSILFHPLFFGFHICLARDWLGKGLCFNGKQRPFILPLPRPLSTFLCPILPPRLPPSVARMLFSAEPLLAILICFSLCSMTMTMISPPRTPSYLNLFRHDVTVVSAVLNVLIRGVPPLNSYFLC